MPIAIRSFAKINFGLKIGPLRPDGFHQLYTIYQTIALGDVVRVELAPGAGIEIRCANPRVPCDATNTCYRMAEAVLKAVAGGQWLVASGRVPNAVESAPEPREKQIPRGLKPARDDNKKGRPAGTAGAVPFQNKVIITIEKQLPVQGGMGAASSNAVATLLGLERALGVEIPQADKLRLAAEVGSDLPLFLIGGTVLGLGRGEEVYALPDLPALPLVVVIPAVGVSTPQAFADWDRLSASGKLTASANVSTIKALRQHAVEWRGQDITQGQPASGVPALGGDRAETPLLDLVRTGIENDFEQVVFPEYPELLEVKRLLEYEGARVASLSGSGSTLYGVFDSEDEAQQAAVRMSAAGHAAVATTTLTREQYWKAVAGG